jgi:hypothetical protein
MAAELGSLPWLDEVMQATIGTNVGVDGDRQINFRHSDRPDLVHCQRWEAGRLTEWRLGGSATAHATVSMDYRDLVAVLIGAPGGGHLSVAGRHSSPWHLPLTPVEMREVADQPWPGADFDVKIAVPDHPLGPRVFVYRFRDGLPMNDVAAGGSPETLFLEMPFYPGVSVLTGQTAFREVASRSTVGGSVYVLACLAGLVASPEGMARLADMRRLTEHGAAALEATARLLAVKMESGPGPHGGCGVSG